MTSTDTGAVGALNPMQQAVVDAQRRVTGVVHLHDLWRTQAI